MKNKELKGGIKNMKTAITIVIALLVISVFGLALTSAVPFNGKSNLNSHTNLAYSKDNKSSKGNNGQNENNGNQKSVSFADLTMQNQAVTEDINNNEIENASSEIDHSVSDSAKLASFVQVFRGVGWSTNSTNGEFVSLFWVDKTFDVNGTEQDKALGLINIGSKVNYRLDLDSQTNNSYSFNVSNAKTNETGSLELDQQNSFANFQVWTGTLVIGSSTYNLDIATRENTLNGAIQGRYETNENSTVNETSKNSTKLTGTANALTRGNGLKVGLNWFQRLKNLFSRK